MIYNANTILFVSYGAYLIKDLSDISPVKEISLREASFILPP